MDARWWTCLVVAALAVASDADSGARAQAIAPARAQLTAPVARFAAALASGRLVLRDLTFAAGSDRLDAAARPQVRRLAAAINATSGTYLIEAHVGDTGEPQRDLALSQRRALEVKALLILEGVPPGRLVAVGYGASRPLASATGAAGQGARIEVAAVQ